MTLRARLTLFFVLIVVVPLVGAGLVTKGLLQRELERRTSARAAAAANVLGSARKDRLDHAAQSVRAIAKDLRVPVDAHALAARRNAAGLDFLLVAGADGHPIASDVRPQAFRDGDRTAEDIVVPLAPAGVDRFTERISKTLVLEGGLLEDGVFDRAMAKATGSGVLVVDGGRVISASTRPPADVAGVNVVLLPGEHIGVFVHAEGGIASVLRLYALFGVLGLVIALVLGSVLARLIARPLDRVAEGALAIARGDLQQRVEVNSPGVIGRLGDAFNHMAANLQATVWRLEASRDELRHALGRLGEALGSTGALQDMLPTLLHSAATTLGARAGTLYRIGPEGTSAAATYGDVGDDRTTHAATQVRTTGEPFTTQEVAAVPLRRRGVVIGVLALAAGDDPFGDEEIATLTSFVAHASIAIDNVLLREEAERASFTDPLTGVRNRRYLDRLLRAEIDRASRYAHPLSIVMIDIDHFKAINDRFGHAAGDGVLVEVCRRIESQIRSGVDVIARYGGEEFVLVLPETPASGAAAVAGKVLAAVAGRRIDPGLDVTISAGVATFPADGRSSKDLTGAADAALYRAKEGGRARFCTSAEFVGV